MSMHVRLTGVSETLFIPLCARAMETSSPTGIIRDTKAVEICDKLQYDHSRFGWFWAGQIGVAIRTQIFDRKASEFLQRRPNAVVTNLGAGLCTRFYRVDNGSVKWFEVDLPDVKKVWSTVLGESDRHLFLACSVMDFSWMEQVKKAQGDAHLFILEGLLMYFRQADVKRLMAALKENFPGAEILIEAISPMLAASSSFHPLLSKTQARFAWGIGSLKEMESWGYGLRLIDEAYLFDYYPERWRFLRLFFWNQCFRRQMKIGHLQFPGR